MVFSECLKRTTLNVFRIPLECDFFTFKMCSFFNFQLRFTASLILHAFQVHGMVVRQPHALRSGPRYSQPRLVPRCYCRSVDYVP